ncbi:MAG: efflux RND transporter periplasmic adaptor subunit [Nitrospiraceae bacterium]|nr:efflux RND transporter periplasmic adaptor subunit [Nitrospiraceae bacterium]
MKWPFWGVLIVVAAAGLSAGGYLAYKGEARKAMAAAPAPEAGAPVASVEVAPIRSARMQVFVTAYGDVVPAPGAVQVASMPYEIRVRRIMVSAGQKISRGEPLLEVEPSPDTVLELKQAETAYQISRQNLDHIKQLFALKLATNTQILKAREAFRRASLQLEILKKMGVGGPRVIRSGVDGLVSHVDVQQGAIVADGKPLVEVISQNRLEARLGVEPNGAERFVSGQTVYLSSVNEPAPKKVTGKIRKISRAINPATRLVDVFVSLPGSARGFLLGEYIRGEIEAARSYGMVVPGSAVLPEGGSYVLYTVRNGRAVKHIVQTGLESGGETQVRGGGLKDGEMAVVLGNYELKDGMKVRVEKTR